LNNKHKNAKKKRVRENPSNLVGRTFNGLKVLSIISRNSKSIQYQVFCKECAKDSELFGDGYFVITKGNLLAGKLPCGCSKNYRWSLTQYLIRAGRVAADKNYKIIDIVKPFKGNKTKIKCECLVDNHIWEATFSNLINYKQGCPKCAFNYKPTEQDALNKCKIICADMAYDVLGFPDGYKNKDSRFEYLCSTHGIQNVSYHSFVWLGTRCFGCAKEKQVKLGNGNGYIYNRKDEQDFLYILSFDNKFIKVGRSFNVEKRISRNGLQKYSKINNIIKLRIFSGKHQDIYNIEQQILKELRQKDFQYHLNWTTEAFMNDCLPYLNSLLTTYKQQGLTEDF